MSPGTRTERPPAAPGTVAPEPIDCLRIVWWAQLGYLHGARHGRPPERAFSAFIALLWWPFFLLLVLVQVLLLVRPRARYYLTPQRDAVIAVVAHKSTWQISEHASARPGHGRGRALRDLIVPTLTSAADLSGITIQATAATAGLSQLYASEIPGLIDVGPAIPRGRHLVREPQTSDQSPAQATA